MSISLRASFVVFLTLAVAGCGGESGDDTGKDKPSKPTKAPKDLIVGAWDTYLQVDVPALAKQHEKVSKLPPDKAKAKAEQLVALLEANPGMRIHITWQFNADGTAVMRRIPAMQADDKIRHQTWKLVSEDGPTATFQIEDAKNSAYKPRTVKITFQNDDTFHVVEDPQLKGTWVTPVKNPTYSRSSDTDLKNVPNP